MIMVAHGEPRAATIATLAIGDGRETIMKWLMQATLIALAIFMVAYAGGKIFGAQAMTYHYVPEHCQTEHGHAPGQRAHWVTICR